MGSLFSVKFKTSILLVCLLGMIHCMAASSQGGNETDKMSLLNFKAGITDDPFGIMQSWNDSAHFCNWLGVFCGRRHQRVVELDLSFLKLSGSISPHIGNLSFLRAFYIYDNSLRGEIPSEITHLRRLEILSLSNNSIGGQIPSNISACSNLWGMDIGYNQLVGEIPSAVSSLSKLQYLAADNNRLTGSIPFSFGNLSSLVTLALLENHLDGSIPYPLGRLIGLKYFYIAGNRFSGNLPPSLFNLSSMIEFDVAENEIEGQLPTVMGIATPTLTFLSFASNKFNGSIPISTSNASNLENLYFNHNKFTGEVPSLENLIRLESITLSYNQLGSARINDLSFLCTLTNATSFNFLYLNINNFVGTLPGCIGNLSSTLQALALDNNGISGIIPAGIGALANLNGLSLSGNRLSGHLPSVISKLQKLQKLYLGANKFTGEIPHSISNLTLLIELTLGDNNFHGTIPSSLGKCRNLLLLDLSSNNLTGNIPPQIFELASLSIYLNLSRNSLIGALPREIRNLKNLGKLLVDHNLLSGEIPSSLGSCVRLEVIKMQGNSFQGSIPSSLSALRGLRVLDLSQNNFSGQIPKFLGIFVFLKSLNLSFNNFEGLVPSEGVFKNGSATSVMGNSKLCGGIPDFHLTACDFKRSNNTRLTRKTRIVIIAVAGLLGAVFLPSFVFLLRLRKRTQTNQLPSENSLLRVSYQNLYDATNGFSASNLVSVGSFGSVYKGALGEGGLLIAVKVLNLRDRRAAKSFVDECEALRNIRHRNLVKVLTACSSIDYEGNDFKAIVYEFMVNGSLEEWLHPIVEVDGNNEAPKKFNLLQRLNVAIDIASALDYLHHHCETTIVHCDMKPSNVLLDGELTGHVSDFGIAKFIVNDMNNSPNNHSSSIGLRGTIGYAPPEYGVGEQVSTSGDIYSYGILLLEMFTGKRPTNDMFKDDWNLHKFAESALPDGVTEILDPILLQEIEAIDTRRSNNRIRKNIVMEGLNLIIGIGVACSAELPGERMNIGDVISKLCSIRNKLLHSERRTGRAQS